MSVQPGQTLGKYRLIEKVGQGGMAVVYRGHDTVLKREVAIKVLHHHLAEHREARERFAREAEAVAKLRHENILEIHDFSGLDSDETYIVTEFIEGCTLKEFITEHALRFPEIGAMISSQVCRALAHAHGLGVLHRDVKPENIMIRSDGVVKLTDFGIAQMIDLQRMTVTGQLLGSPAYMSPEHVEGDNLDFRTDVFAVGIVLYQLVTGELPFHGKNPHEILKRIADCQYPDPTRANPRVGRELGDIISTALQRAADDRYGDVSLMQQALDQYLEGSGIHSPKEELARFFDSPVAFQMALEKRLVDFLTERGKTALHSNRVLALELFNRVLSIDSSNAEVLDHLRRLGAKQRNLRVAGALVAIILFVGLAMLAKERFVSVQVTSLLPVEDDAGLSVPSVTDAAISLPADASPSDASVVRPTTPPRDASSFAVDPTDPGPPLQRRRPDAAPDIEVLAPEVRKFRLKLTPRGSEYRVGSSEWIALPSGTTEITVPSGEQKIWARNESCCEEILQVIPATQSGGELVLTLSNLPAKVTPICEVPNVRVTINGRAAVLGRTATIPITRYIGTEPVRIGFFSDKSVDERTITVGAKDVVEHRCQL